MKTTHDFDLAVIGAGAAGIEAALRARALGATVVLLEAGKVGGDSLWGAGLTARTLAQSARVLDMVQRSEEFGVHLEKSRLVWAAVRLRVADVRDQLRGRLRSQLEAAGVELRSGHAQFSGPHSLTLVQDDGRQMVTAGAIVIATGSVPLVPPLPGLHESGYSTPDQLITRASLPRSLLFLGAGLPAVEMAQIFQRLGTRVTLVREQAQLLPDEEPEVSAVVEKVLRNEGVQLHLNTRVTAAGTADKGKWAEIEGPDGTQRLEAGEIVLAAARAPRIEHLNLTAAGVAVGPEGVLVNETLQSSVAHIYACGGAAGRQLQPHAARHEAAVAVQRALRPGGTVPRPVLLPHVTFTDPETARLGLTHAEARIAEKDVRVCEVPFSNMDRAIILGETSGFARAVTGADGRLLGVHIVGPAASELIAAFIPLVQQGGTLRELADTVYPHPTLSEIARQLGEAGSAA